MQGEVPKLRIPWWEERERILQGGAKGCNGKGKIGRSIKEKMQLHVPI